MALDIADFSAFFQGIHDKTPFLWQMRLAEKVAREGWPDVIDLPTASGKTACVDIAVFHLALSPEAARRIFFVVDRRLIVNQVFERMCRIAGKISSAQDGVLKEVATRLQSLAGPFAPNPLEAYELRGGVYRDPSWVKTPLQPTLVSSTVDQVGSRILFRGYGVSDSAWPIHAGLIANDSLIFLDEAHCSPAFARTLQAIERYRGSDWACEPLPQSFRFVEMTATPTRDSPKRFQLEPEDKSPDQLGNRIFAAKPTRVVEGKHKSNDPLKSAAVFVKEMDALKHELPSARRIGIIVNRIATARAIYSELLADTSYAGNVHLMIGRMRPIDRDRLTADLAPLKSGAIRSPQDPFRIVVATQCLEVGADLDFDILLTECASIDALLQRFGRLNRLGAAPECRGCIIASTSQAEGKNSDPVYGPSLSDTWRWLNTLTAADGTVNMGIEAPAGHPPSVAQCLTESVKDLRIPEKLSPALLPAHLDALCQTNPVPACEPSVALFLHGVDSGEPDVQVVWRADLELDQIDQWPAIIRLCPPVSAEAMPVRISTFRKWLSGDDNDSDSSDLEGQSDNTEKALQPKRREVAALLIRGKEVEALASLAQVRPGDTIVLPASVECWNDFGHIPPGAEIDCGDYAQEIARHRRVVRLHPALIKKWVPDQEEDKLALAKLLSKDDGDIPTLENIIAAYPHQPLTSIDVKSARLRPYPYAGACLVQSKLPNLESEEDSGDDNTSETVAIRLQDHIDHVVAAVKSTGPLLGDKNPDFVSAAQLHDHGKSDLRFQTLLRNGDAIAARYATEKNFLAKSASMLAPGTKRDTRSDYPDGFRHELLSLLFAEQQNLSALAMHLIATHHGYCRPFAPYVKDPAPPSASFQGLKVSSHERLARPMHRLSSGLVQRFWELTRHYGWWGTAYYEALFRLADWKASAEEAEGTTNK